MFTKLQFTDFREEKIAPSGGTRRFLSPDKGLLNPSLGDTSLLTGEVAEVVQFGATHLAVFVHRDFLNERAVHGENTLNADVTRHFANGEALLVLAAVDGDNVATELLDTLLVTFLNTISNGDLVTSCESRELLLLAGKCLFGNLNQIHFIVLFMD